MAENKLPREIIAFSGANKKSFGCSPKLFFFIPFSIAI